MTLSGEEFGARLRRQREHRGVTLAAVAESTKIKRSLLVDLERGDLSRWPAGIYRRAFLREYADIIGASPADTVNECLRLFPETGETPPSVRPREVNAASRELRLTMASPAFDWIDPRRLLASLLDGLVIALVAAGAASSTGIGVWTACAVCAIVYHGVATAWLGRSPASWYLSQRLRRRSPARISLSLGESRSLEAPTTRTRLTLG